MTKITLLHGDNQPASRNQLNQILAAEKKHQVQPHWLNGETIPKKELESVLQTANLFTQEIVIIENLLSRPQSQEKQACLQLLSHYQGPKNIILWEKKSISPTTINQLKLSPSDIQHFKLPSTIFQLLDSFSPQNKRRSLYLLHQTLEKSEPGFIFIMLARRLSQLIIAKSAPDQLAGKPWQKQKLLRQSQSWTLDQLLTLHQQFLNLDLNLKTSSSPLSLADHLDLLLLKL